MKQKCLVPPKGWHCTRERGHDGPCAPIEQIPDTPTLCLPKALAVILGIRLELILLEIGHDGREMYWPSCGPVHGRRGFHMQEIIKVAFGYNYVLAPFEGCICSVSTDINDVRELTDFEPVVNLAMLRGDGIILGQREGKTRHALAWKDGHVIDPDNVDDSLDGFAISAFWLLNRISSKS